MSKAIPGPSQRWPRACTAFMIAASCFLLSACSDRQEQVTIGLITKQEVNPYWVTMRQVAEKAAREDKVRLLTATGTSDVDVESQKAALRKMIDAGAKGILIAPTRSTELLPEIEAARGKGVTVVAVDTPFQPADAVDAYLTTDNAAAGHLVGQYAVVKAQELGLTPKIALLGMASEIRSSAERQAGFLSGFGISDGDAAIVARIDTQGDRERAKAGMAQILSQHVDVNVIYTVNEPAGLGALEALKQANANLRRVVLVSIDGGCAAIKSAVRRGEIDATAMQFPQNMAREGIKLVAASLRGGAKPSGYVDTGVRLITDDKAPGVPSEDVAYGVRNCWGD